VLREVEKLGLETSGLDRFNLLEDFAILDLLALARVCANPLDDMAVALTLISPLFRWSETDLGKAPLFETPKIQETLYPFIHLASQMSVLEFFVEVLQKMRYKQNFFQSYGRSCAVVFEAFFHEIRIFESECASHMSIFLSWIEGRHLEVKRDTSKGNIRPMTIHGSKGSEASTVILLEADSTPRLQERLFLYKDTVFWTPHKELWPEAFKTLREHHKDKNIQEYNRLLYVALTRARDHLYIFATEKGSELSWYQGLSAS
jgi:ATP-dependent helicase/nuclease subunit A